MGSDPPRMTLENDRVTLREITAETVIPVIRLSVTEDQKQFVAPNAVSLAQALFAPEAWYRAIYFDDELAGFVMLADEALKSPRPEAPTIGLWRFMIDAKFQRRGIGRAALLLVIAHVRSKRPLFPVLDIVVRSRSRLARVAVPVGGLPSYRKDRRRRGCPGIAARRDRRQSPQKGSPRA